MRKFPEVKMGMHRIATAVLLLVAGQAMGQSRVEFHLALGGDNHAAVIKAAALGSGSHVYFTRGAYDDSMAMPIAVQRPADNTLTWEVRVLASGTQASGNGAGYAIQGVANYVFDLELHQGDSGFGEGTLVTGADFISTLHDGATACTPSQKPLCPPCLAGAAFALRFNVLSYGPGRIVDAAYSNTDCSGKNPKGGANMRVFLFPTREPGKLLGMGAGYASWSKSGVTSRTQEGLGMVTLPSGSAGLGDGPVNEGQIDVSSLADGQVYTLLLKAGDGINVLRGDKPLATNSPAVYAFATPAEDTPDTQLSFVLSTTPANFHLTSAKSQKLHGSAGTFDIALPIEDGQYATEPRLDGPTSVVLTFDDGPVVAADGTIDVGTDASAEVKLSAGSGTATVDGSTMTLSLAGVAADGCLTIDLQGLETAAGAELEGDANLMVRVLYGDATVDGGVDVSDLTLIKVNKFKTVDLTNFLADVTVDGGIDVSDLTAVKVAKFHATSCP